MAVKNFTFKRTGSLAASQTITFSISGSAVYGTGANQDYTLAFVPPATGTLTIAAGSTSATGQTIIIPAGSATADLALTTTDDAVFEVTETVNVTITGSTPVVAIDSLMGAAQMQIIDNDFSTVWLSQPTAPIINTLGGVDYSNTATISSNGGTAPGNGFTSWAQVSAGRPNGSSALIGLNTTNGLDQGSTARPILVKIKLRLPSSTPTLPFTTISAIPYYGVFGVGSGSAQSIDFANNTGSGLFLGYSVSGGNATFVLIFRPSGGSTTPSVVATASTTVPLGSWIDIVIEELGNIWNVYTGSGFSLTATDTANSNGTLSAGNNAQVVVSNTGALAGIRATNGQFFSASMIPITLANL